MRIITAIKSLCLIATLASADESAPFNLVVLSPHKDLNGSVLDACHVGAAEESLCVIPDIQGPGNTHDTFLFNSSYPIDTEGDTEGYLWFDLPTCDPNNGCVYYPSPVTLKYTPTSNVAWLSMFPGDNYTADYFSFGDDNLLAQIGEVNNLAFDFGQVPFYRWYICDWNINGYLYSNLIWVMGTGRPEATDCEKVNITRVFV